jgi:hypothetical protein
MLVWLLAAFGLGAIWKASSERFRHPEDICSSGSALADITETPRTIGTILQTVNGRPLTRSPRTQLAALPATPAFVRQVFVHRPVAV